MKFEKPSQNRAFDYFLLKFDISFTFFNFINHQIHNQKIFLNSLTPLTPLLACQQRRETTFGHFDHCEKTFLSHEVSKVSGKLVERIRKFSIGYLCLPNTTRFCFLQAFFSHISPIGQSVWQLQWTEMSPISFESICLKFEPQKNYQM